MSKKTKNICTAITVLLAVVLIALFDNDVIGNAYVKRVLNLAAIYAIISVSMNLVNGFTGLFSLGQAGFMLIGAYSYAIFAIPAEQHAAVYQYFEGGSIQFSIPQVLSGVLGESGGAFLGAIICLIIAGAVAAGFAAPLCIPGPRL